MRIVYWEGTRRGRTVALVDLGRGVGGSQGSGHESRSDEGGDDDAHGEHVG
jgi:hypothetical protein